MAQLQPARRFYERQTELYQPKFVSLQSETDPNIIM